MARLLCGNLPFHSRSLHFGLDARKVADNAGRGRNPCLQSRNCSNSDTGSRHRHDDHDGPRTLETLGMEMAPRSFQSWPSTGWSAELHAPPSSRLLCGKAMDTLHPPPTMRSQSRTLYFASPFEQKGRMLLNKNIRRLVRVSSTICNSLGPLADRSICVSVNSKS